MPQLVKHLQPDKRHTIMERPGGREEIDEGGLEVLPLPPGEMEAKKAKRQDKGKARGR